MSVSNVTLTKSELEAMPPLESLVRQLGPLEFQQSFSREAFISLAERFPDLQMEREADGKILIMSPVKKGSGRRESQLHGLLFIWNNRHSLGELFSPSTGFDLPSGVIKSPDVGWISNEANVSSDEEELFVKTVPDFIAEVRSSSDRLSKLQEKMTQVWMENGVRLAWLIDPYEETAYIYRQGQAPETIKGFDDKSLLGEDVMPGFVLPLKEMKRR